MSERKREVEERILTIPLAKAFTGSIKKKTPKAVRFLLKFVKKHMKSENILLSTEVNEALWSRGIEGAPRQIRVKAVRGRDNEVTVYLAKEE
jgi:large subunit ribosomal protein L31e